MIIIIIIIKKAKIATNLGIGSKYMLLSISFCRNIMCMFV